MRKEINQAVVTTALALSLTVGLESKQAPCGYDWRFTGKGDYFVCKTTEDRIILQPRHGEEIVMPEDVKSIFQVGVYKDCIHWVKYVPGDNVYEDKWETYEYLPDTKEHVLRYVDCGFGYC